MPVTAVPGRQGRHQAGTGRVAAIRRAGRPAALTVTLNIPLTGETLSPEAGRLLEALRELVAAGAAEADIRELPTMPEVLPATAEPTPADGPADGPGGAVEVRLLLASRQVLVGGAPLPLTRLEFDLLQFLAGNPRRVFSRAQLLTAVWGYEHTGERTVDVHVRRLRVKMGAVPLITTVYGVGYRLADDAHVTQRPAE